MQVLSDGLFFANLITGSVSVIVGTYLILLWHQQDNPLLTDLPLLFGVAFISQAVNSVIRMLPTLGLLEMTIYLFKIRAMVILCSTLPLWVAVLHIWLPQFQRYHRRIIYVITSYWSTVVILATVEQIILILCVPVLLVAAVSLIITFAITWRTGRLKEVRSDLMVLSILLAIIGELTAAYNIVVNTLATSIGIILAGIALVNPWYTNPLRLETISKSYSSTATVANQHHSSGDHQI